MAMNKVVMMAGASLLSCALAVAPAWADPDRSYGGHGDKSYGGHGDKSYGGHGDGYGRGGHGAGAAMMEMMMHGGTGHLIRHLLKHEKDIGLSADQVTKLKEMQLNMDKTRIKMEADIQVTERELKALIEDEKSDLGAIESKLKQSQETQIGLRLASIKARREVLALLTPEQRTKQQAEHDKVMQQHKSTGSERGMGSGKGHGNPHGAAPANPHQSSN
ncbi:MAG: Spy/CpxP family protein refolding chaperone [Nitrospiraceae bacterium]